MSKTRKKKNKGCQGCFLLDKIWGCAFETLTREPDKYKECIENDYKLWRPKKDLVDNSADCDIYIDT